MYTVRFCTTQITTLSDLQLADKWATVEEKERDKRELNSSARLSEKSQEMDWTTNLSEATTIWWKHKPCLCPSGSSNGVVRRQQ